MLKVQVGGCPVQRTVVIGQSVLEHSINTPFESVGGWGLVLRTDEGTLVAHAEIQSAVESYSTVKQSISKLYAQWLYPSKN